ncbi:IPTL-CTERM sorting domain-containing protein [Comamonas koreensis]|jgi:hypothetical protein|uniref:IPTL-CTERM sorting domain-containing protein n=1 Tax=Comamonas koreensis TaxID=160825 RepID=UPI0015FB1B70|nr:IPTL-CTERM sorting domain-containing protein [Comamonas koreensis]
MRQQMQTLAAALAMAVPGLSSAAFVSGAVNYNFSSIYSGTSEELRYDANGALYSDESVLLICIDHSTQPPFANAATPVPQAQFDTEAGASAIKGASGAAGEAAIYWLLDQYYLSYYKNGSVEQRRALQYALWELGNDYDGSAASINISAGASRPASENVIEYGGSDQAAFVSAYNSLYDAMKASLPTLRTSYRSGTYTMDLFRNRDPAYQHMVALIERAPPNTVPIAEPTITGTSQVGSTVTGSYTYADNNNDVENPSGTTYQFVTSASPSISSSSDGTVVASGTTGGASQTPTYTLQPADQDKNIFFCVRPDAQTGATPGLEVCTTALGPVTELPPNVVPTAVPSITGTPQVGSTVTGSYTYADNNSDVENPSGTTYQFVTSPNPSISSSSDGTVVASGTTGGAGQTPTYTLQAADLNQYVFFCVKPAAQTGASPGLEVCTSPVGPVTTRVVQQAPTPVPGLGPWALMGLTPLIALLGIRRQRKHIG